MTELFEARRPKERRSPPRSTAEWNCWTRSAGKRTIIVRNQSGIEREHLVRTESTSGSTR